MPTRNVEIRNVVNANIERRQVINLDQASPIEEVGSVPDAAKPYISVTEYGDSLVHRTVLTCTGLPISISDDTVTPAQYGGIQVYTMPEGLIYSKGAIISGNLTLGITGTIINTFTGVNALGTVTASTGATLVSTEATWLQSTANATAVAKVAAISSVSVATALTETSARVVDGTTTPAPVFLNFAIADDVSHTVGTGSFTGTITISWEKIGDK